MECEVKHFPAEVRIIPWTIETFRIRLMSWNIEGLDSKALVNRTIAICDRIIREDPHVVFLQEVIPPTEKILAELCPMYKLITVDDDNDEDDDGDDEEDDDEEGDDDEEDDDEDGEFGPGYYVAMLLKKDVVEIKEVQNLLYPNTVQGRTLLRVMCTIKGEQFVLMTTHLESCRPFSAKRMEQLQLCFSKCLKEDSDKTVIFGGDLNLRESEARNVGTPKDIFDLWKLNGEDPDTMYTWDMLYNDNLSFKDASPRCRFDRIYMRHSDPVVTKLVHFELAGFGRLEDCKMFCSDHWALLAHFNIISKVPYYNEQKKSYDEKRAW